MKRAIKTIDVYNGEMYAVLTSNRIKLFDCNASIEIVEHSGSSPILGKGKVIIKRDIVLLVTFDLVPSFDVDEHMLSSISGFEFCGDIQRQDGTFISMTFNHCMLADDLDLTSGGSCQFHVECAPDVVNKLKAM